MAERKRLFNTKMIAVTGILTGIEIILQVIGNYINPSFSNINLSLIPIALGAILYGPLVGGFLGLVCGVMVILSPSTISIFFAVSPVGTIVTCILKTTLAGVISGLVMKLFKKNNFVGSIVSSALVPIINTGLFAVFAALFFKENLNALVASNSALYPNLAAALFLGFIGLNFIIEIISTVILTPSLYKIIEQNSRNPYKD